jgi:hypothetical protein
MEIVWNYYNDLSSARTSNGYSPNPLSYSEIAAWRDLTDNDITPFEVKVIKRLDIAYLNFSAKKQSKNK